MAVLDTTAKANFGALEFNNKVQIYPMLLDFRKRPMAVGDVLNLQDCPLLLWAEMASFKVLQAEGSAVTVDFGFGAHSDELGGNFPFMSIDGNDVGARGGHFNTTTYGFDDPLRDSNNAALHDAFYSIVVDAAASNAVIQIEILYFPIQRPKLSFNELL